ncbi:MAG: aminotransferase class I/II-fold pyridoxal phosphate-dependent enzyme [Clostridiales bacterium]|nr:aminotransferase class I/II-fold pyridoxal phosphate-dependent enzyme [Clostridiales bacterium]
MKILFQCDYNEGAHPRILDRLVQTNMEQTPGYGEDIYCQRAAELICKKCQDDTLAVHFMVGGTQTNATVIDAALRSHQGVICADTGHINVHETGAVEAMGHKVLALPCRDGKLTAEQVEKTCLAHGDNEHMVQPKMVYISNPTELGTIYTRAELEELSAVCRKYDLILFLDGARLGYGLAAADNELDLPLIASCCDVFYIGGTKAGALFGEAVVIRNEALKRDFRYYMKQKGGLLAKGRLLGIQFITLFEDGLYEELSEHAIRMADELRAVLEELNYPFLVKNGTNQLFPILPDEELNRLAEDFEFNYEQKTDETHHAVRFCTSWATREENVEKLKEALRGLKQK